MPWGVQTITLHLKYILDVYILMPWDIQNIIVYLKTYLTVKLLKICAVGCRGVISSTGSDLEPRYFGSHMILKSPGPRVQRLEIDSNGTCPSMSFL